MRNGAMICYLFSLLSFGMGYTKMLDFKNAIDRHVKTYEYMIDLSLATSFLVLTILFAVIGFALFALRIMDYKQ